MGILDFNRDQVIATAIKLGVIIGLWLLASRICVYVVNKFLARERAFFKSDPRRIATLNTLLKSVIRYVITFIAVISILDLFGVPISSVLAGAGIAGIALGFGAQSFVRDVITGFFILYEDQYSVGDYVTIAGASGIVEEIGLRVTKLRDFNGDLYTIPNGTIDKTTNHSRGNMRVLVDVGITYEEDADRAVRILEDVCARLRAENPNITSGPDVLGIQKLGESSVVLRIVAMTLPMQQWDVERQILKAVKRAFDDAGIDFAYPHLVVVKGSSGKGTLTGSADVQG